MSGFHIVLVLLVAIGVLAPLARKLDIPSSIVLVLGGIGLSFVPKLKDFEFDPELTFLIFVPPMLYSAALTTSVRAFRRSLRSIMLLAVGLVLATTIAVGVVAHFTIPVLGWAPAMVLGAIVAPPDAAVATSIARRLGIPKRLVTLLEGESLMNDTTAFVAYRMAVTATVTGAFSPGSAIARFVWMGIGGVVVGLIVAQVSMWLRKRLAHTTVENMISLLTAFAAYLPAEAIGASGVLAVVTAGLLLSRVAPKIVSARTRIQNEDVWTMLNFMLEGLIFLLIGLKLGALGRELSRHFQATLLLHAVVVSAVVIMVRLVWMFPGAYLPPLVSKTIRDSEGPAAWRPVAFTAWTGLRGGDTLVTAIALPLLTASGAPFPGRDEIVAISFGVIVVTLLFQGLTLRPLARLLGLHADDAQEEREEARARRVIADEGLARLRVEAERAKLPGEWTEKMVAYHELRTQRDANTAKCADAESPIGVAFERVQRHVLNTERVAVIRLRDQQAIDDDVLRRIQREIDYEELRISEEDER